MVQEPCDPLVSEAETLAGPVGRPPSDSNDCPRRRRLDDLVGRIPFFQPGGAFQTLDWLVQATDALLSDSGGAFPTLDELVQATDALVRSRDPSGGGTLQYMIYPWGRPGVGDKRRLPIEVRKLGAPGTTSSETVPQTRRRGGFYISGSPGDLRVREIATGDDLPVHGRTADDLVSQVASLCGDGQHDFIWDRNIRSLQHAD